MLFNGDDVDVVVDDDDDGVYVEGSRSATSIHNTGRLVGSWTLLTLRL